MMADQEARTIADERAYKDGEVTSHPEYMLTTVDNPYNPFTDFPGWLAWDTARGYKTSQLLGRIAATSEDLSLGDQQAAINAAIDEVVEENVLGLFRKVSRESFETLSINSET